MAKTTASAGEGPAKKVTKKKVTKKKTTKKVASKADVLAMAAPPPPPPPPAAPRSKKKTTKKAGATEAKAESAPAAPSATRTEAAPEKRPAGEQSGGGQAQAQGQNQSQSQAQGQNQSQGQNQNNNNQGGGHNQGQRHNQKNHNQQRHNPPGQGQSRSAKRKKNKQGGGGGGQQHNQMSAKRKKAAVLAGLQFANIPANQLPRDEDIENDAREILEGVTDKQYAKAASEAVHITDLQRMKIEDLHEYASEQGIEEPNKLPRQELIFAILTARAEQGEIMFGEGTLEVMAEGYGFLRSPEVSYTDSPDDVYVSQSMIKKHGLRKGMELSGAIRPPKEGEKYFALMKVDEVNGMDASETKTLPIFEDLTPLHPEDRFVLETEPGVVETRIIDLVAPIGRGQRALIVAPPRTGKTVLMQKMTQAISSNYPEVKVLVLLIDERPEEVTDFKRNTAEGVEVIASTFDEDSSRHVQVAEMVIEKARRYVEFGGHVVILLDSITRLARAYNAAQPNTGKIMSGGIDSGALTRPKKFFGSARAIENGGSLTILGTALVDTGSKADEVIFEEFKGTGNSELHLDRKLVEKRVYPAIDIAASGTRREELLLDPKELELVYRLRKVLSDMNVVEAMELLKGRISKSKTNAEFLITMAKGFG